MRNAIIFYEIQTGDAATCPCKRQTDMNRHKWNEIAWARQVLGLPEEVTRKEIQAAYRRKGRKLHPDTAAVHSDGMTELNRAYRLLMDYVDAYKIHLSPSEAGMNDEDWWMYHFGQDPVWGGDKNEKGE